MNAVRRMRGPRRGLARRLCVAPRAALVLLVGAWSVPTVAPPTYRTLLARARLTLDLADRLDGDSTEAAEQQLLSGFLTRMAAQLPIEGEPATDVGLSFLDTMREIVSRLEPQALDQLSELGVLAGSCGDLARELRSGDPEQAARINEQRYAWRFLQGHAPEVREISHGADLEFVAGLVGECAQLLLADEAWPGADFEIGSLSVWSDEVLAAGIWGSPPDRGDRLDELRALLTARPSLTGIQAVLEALQSGLEVQLQEALHPPSPPAAQEGGPPDPTRSRTVDAGPFGGAGAGAVEAGQVDPAAGSASGSVQEAQVAAGSAADADSGRAQQARPRAALAINDGEALARHSSAMRELSRVLKLVALIDSHRQLVLPEPLDRETFTKLCTVFDELPRLQVRIADPADFETEPSPAYERLLSSSANSELDLRQHQQVLAYVLGNGPKAQLPSSPVDEGPGVWRVLPGFDYLLEIPRRGGGPEVRVVVHCGDSSDRVVPLPSEVPDGYVLLYTPALPAEGLAAGLAEGSDRPRARLIAISDTPWTRNQLVRRLNEVAVEYIWQSPDKVHPHEDIHSFLAAYLEKWVPADADLRTVPGRQAALKELEKGKDSEAWVGGTAPDGEPMAALLARILERDTDVRLPRRAVCDWIEPWADRCIERWQAQEAGIANLARDTQPRPNMSYVLRDVVHPFRR